MKINIVLSALILTIILGFSACDSKEKVLKQDARKIADAMCKSVGGLHKLETANPADCVLIRNLRAEVEQNKVELNAIYVDFRKRYADKLKTPEFNKTFHKYMSKYMVDCKNLSKEDRENFERDANAK